MSLNRVLAFLLGGVMLMVGLSSCGDDDDNVIEPLVPENTLSELKLEVDVRSMYSALGIEQSISGLLGSYGGLSVKAWTLVYDDSGVLIDSISTNEAAIDNRTHVHNLENGSYTVVSAATLVGFDGDYNLQMWKLDDVDRLSTVKMRRVSDDMCYWFNCMGISALSVDVVSEHTNRRATPKLVGSLLMVGYENFSGSDFNVVSFMLKKHADAILAKEDPATGSRIYYDSTNGAGAWDIEGVCYMPDGLSNAEDDYEYMFPLQLYVPETDSQHYCYGIGSVTASSMFEYRSYPSNNSWFVFESGQRYYGYCYLDGDGDVKTFIGSYNEFQTWYSGLDSDEPTPNPDEGVVFKTPCISWGTSVSTVHGYMSGYTQLLGNSKRAEATSYDDYATAYAGKNDEYMYAYFFESATSGLYMSYVYFDGDKVDMADMKGYLDENYTFYEYDSEDNLYIYLLDRRTIVVLMSQEDEDGNMVAVAYCDMLDSNQSLQQMAKQSRANVPGLPRKVKAKRGIMPVVNLHSPRPIRI